VGNICFETRFSATDLAEVEPFIPDLGYYTKTVYVASAAFCRQRCVFRRCSNTQFCHATTSYFKKVV